MREATAGNALAEAANAAAGEPTLLSNTLVAHGEPVIRPRLSDNFDYEGDLAVVIGKGGRHIAENDALAHIAGYSCFMDGSLRDYQFNQSLIAGKNFYGTGGFGAVLTTADEAAEPANITVTSRLNGTEMQRGYTRDLIFSIPYLITYISGFNELQPGHVIATDTPDGVGYARDPKVWMKPGDTIEVNIDGISALRNTVVGE